MALHRSISTRAVLMVLLVVGVAGLALGVGAVPDDGTVDSDVNVTVLGATDDVFDRVDDAADARTMTANGTFDRAVEYDDPVVYGDTFVVRIRSATLGDRYADADGANATDRFFGLFDDRNANLTTRALVGPQRQPYEMSLDRSDSRVLPDSQNNTFYVVVDSESVVVTERGSDERYDRFPRYDDFEVSVETRTDGVTTGDEHLFTYVGPEGRMRSERSSLRLAGGGPARIDANATAITLRGSTNLLPGREVTLQAVAPNGTVLASAIGTTTENATSEPDRRDDRSNVRVHLTEAPTDDDEWFTLRATVHNRSVWDRRVVVGPEPRWSNLSAEAIGTDGTDWTLRVDASFRLPDQGIVRIELRMVEGYETLEVPVPEGRSTQTFYIRNVSSPPETELEIETYWDSNGDGEFTFPEDDTFGTSLDVPGFRNDLQERLTIDGAAALRDTETPTPTDSHTQTSTATPTRTESPTPDESPTGTATTPTDDGETPTLTVAKPPTETTDALGTAESTADDGPATDTTSDDGAGFGALVSLAVLTLLGVAAAARTR